MSVLTISDVLQLPATTLAAFATVAAALVAAFTLLLSSAINARTAKAVARDTFRRTHRAETLKPFLGRIDAMVTTLTEVIDAGPALVETLEWVLKMPTHMQQNELSSTRDRLEVLRVAVQDIKRSFDDTAFLALVQKDARVAEGTKECMKSLEAFLAVVRRNPVSLTAVPEQLTVMRVSATEAVWQFGKIRNVIEDAIVEEPGWWMVLWYRLRDKSDEMRREMRPGN